MPDQADHPPRPQPSNGAGPTEAEPSAEPAHENPQSAAGPGDIETYELEDVIPPGGPFPIIGIGASAGGLEALTQLLRALPEHPGMALVVVQHLDPEHESQLPDLLTRATAMPVLTVQDGMAIQPDHVYVIPPNTTMLLDDGHLRLGPRKRGLHLPVDAFFESLARSQGTNAIGIILSGNASDGSQGIRAIKGEGGVTFAQDETSARHSGMPRSAAATGAVDFVLNPADIAEELRRIATHPYVVRPPQAPSVEEFPEGDGDLQRIFTLLQKATRVDFSNYKPNTIRRRLSRRMLVLRLNDLPEYRQYVEEHPPEVKELFNDLLITVTSFFRDREAFESVKQLLAKNLIEHKGDEPVRVWAPGCATGEELYSLAICVYELLQELARPTAMQLFGTDINEVALERARAGIYTDVIAQDLSPERLRRFFVRTDGTYQISKSIRESCVFARQDLTVDPPFSHLDLISCRNVLIYLNASLQRRILPVFHYSLNAGGLLLLGTAESVGGSGELFDLVDKHNHIYTRRAVPVRWNLDLAVGRRGSEQGEPTKAPAAISSADLHRKADRIIQNKYSPAAVVVDTQLQILQFRGHTSTYLEPTPGEASLNLLRMAREGLVLPLRKLIQSVTEQKVSLRETAQYLDPSGEQKNVDIEATPIPGAAPGERYFLLVFRPALKAPEHDAPPPVSIREEVSSPAEYASQIEEQARHLQQQLAETREYLRNLSEDHEAHTEELRAANEEVRSANEELQSTNEELSTTKEELQSSNEELSTLNEELGNRNQELTTLNSDLKNLLATVNIPILMIDSNLRLRRFNPAAEKLLELGAADLGRPVGHLRSGLEVPQLEQRVTSVLETLNVEQHEVQDPRGRWYSVTIRPYRTLDDRIDGAVISIVDIDPLKRSLRSAEEARDYAEAMLDTVREPLVVLDADLRVLRATSAFYETFQASRNETEGRFLYDLGNGQWNQPRLRELLGNALFHDVAFQDYEVQHDFKYLGKRAFRLNGRLIPGRESRRLLIAMEDVTKRREEAEIRYRRLFETAKDGMLVVDDETGAILDVNPYVMELTGYSRDEFIGKPIGQTAPFQASGITGRLIADLRIKEIVRSNTALVARDGRVVNAEVVANRYSLGTRQVIQMNIRDVTERKRAEGALRESRESFRLFVDSVREYAMFQTDPLGEITTWNPGAERLLGYTEEEMIGQSIARLFTPEDVQKGEPEHERERARDHGSTTDLRWHLRKDGTRFFASGVMTAVRDEGGRLLGFAKVMRDTTAEKQSEEQIRRSLREKDILLKEIHHRVKNNLQVIVSLIQLQSDYLRDPAGLQVLREMHNRVRSIARIHEMLYSAADVSHIDFSEYLQKLAKDLFAFYQASPDQVRLRTDIADTHMELSQAIPCGLIANELLSNSLEHAFTDRKPGVVQIGLRAEGDKCILSVGDNGRGLPPDLDPLHATSMGLQLVRLLTEQLQGALQIDRSQGTRFVITFPLKALAGA